MARSVTVDLDTLLDELARRHARGETLDVEGLLARAGPEADRLADLIDRFLERAPRGEPSDEALAYIRTFDEPPILRARIAQALRVDDVVDAIVGACGLRPDQRVKARRYYQQLEGGVLDPTGVTQPVWDVLSRLLGPVERSGSPSRAEPATTAFYRAPAAAIPHAAQPRASALSSREPDEVDRLFGVGPES